MVEIAVNVVNFVKFGPNQEILISKHERETKRRKIESFNEMSEKVDLINDQISKKFFLGPQRTENPPESTPNPQ